jgi:site-specific DNA recombinase
MRSASINEKLECLETERATILQKLGGPTPSPVRLLPNLAEIYRKKVSDLHVAIYSEETRAEAFEIIRTLIDKVLIHEGPNKKPTIELVGDIASMISIALPASKTQKTARERAVLSDQDIRSVEVVAGTRNQIGFGRWFSRLAKKLRALSAFS